MSAIAGILLPGAVADRSRFEKVQQALAHRGSQERVVEAGAVCMAYRDWDVAAGSQPFSWSSLRVVADTVLYNRNELLRALSDAPPQASDAELIVRAYAHWGTDCARHLEGDFAFALWDEAEQRLFCARDPLGLRPFFYRWDARSFVWASEVKGVAADPTYQRAPDEAMVGEYLLGWSHFPDTSATFYRDIRQLPGGHWLTVEANRLKVERYWDISPSEAVSGQRSFEENVEEFRRLFARAVRQRLGGAKRTGVMISGGLDSTSIGGVAEQSAAAQANGRLPPYYVSYFVPDDRGDERSYLRSFEEMYARPVHHLAMEEIRILEDIETGTDLVENAFLDLGWDTIGHLADHLRTQQCQIVATGLGGDNIFPDPSPAYFRDVGSDCGWWAGWQAFQGTCRYYGVSSQMFLGPTLRYLLPAPMKRLAKRALKMELPEWILPEFARRSGLLERVRQPVVRRGFPTWSQEEDHRQVTSGRLGLLLGYFDRVAAAHGFEFRHPFLDPALVRFTLLAPLEHKIRYGETKLLLRHAMEGILPETVRHRRFKGSPGPFLSRRIRTHEAARWQELAGTARFCSAYVKPGHVQRWVRKFQDGDEGALRPAWTLLSLELWLRKSFAA